MKISCANVVGGWVTIMIPTDGKEYTFGPVYNKISDLWDWQRKNLYDVVDGYKLVEVAKCV
jgi:hypothetical protein